MNKIKELRTTSELVLHILQKEPKTRNNDDLLYSRVVEIIGQKQCINTETLLFENFWKYRKKLGFPAFSTVDRARRMIQREHPELAANKEVEEGRKLNEEVFREYAKGGV